MPPSIHFRIHSSSVRNKTRKIKIKVVKFGLQEKVVSQWIGTLGFGLQLGLLKGSPTFTRTVRNSRTTLVSSLFDHMDRDLSCSSILEILKCIAGHPKIIHRDIKSANILLDNNYEAMVTLSQLISDMINVVVNEIITHEKID